MHSKAKGQVTIGVDAKETLLMDVFKRQRIEACGVLIGRIDEAGNWHVEETQPLRNIYDSPVYFEFDPEDLLNVDLTYPGRVIGAYHSHPTGLTRASGTDRLNMKRVNIDQQIPWVWLIVSGPFDRSPTLYSRYSVNWDCCRILRSSRITITKMKDYAEFLCNLKRKSRVVRRKSRSKMIG